MKLLLDTHVFLWSVLAPDNLSPKIRAVFAEDRNELWVSPITVWEGHLLAEKRRVELAPHPRVWLERVLSAIPFREATLTHAVALQSRQLDMPHQDPADRFLAASAIVYELTLVTADQRLLSAAACPTLPAR